MDWRGHELLRNNRELIINVTCFALHLPVDYHKLIKNSINNISPREQKMQAKNRISSLIGEKKWRIIFSQTKQKYSV